MLELHIWGPGHGLPSIDPRCLATVAFLNHELQSDSWTVVPSSNPLLSPTRELPALRDGTIWVSGFRGIVEYVRQSLGSDIDAVMDKRENAECIAFSAFIETHGQELLDLSLYVSRANYESITRPLFSKLLPWPTQYLTPGTLRSQAIARTSHLNITSLDFSSIGPTLEPTGPPQPAQRTSILTTTATTAAFKLTDLTRDFLAPLQALLGDSEYFFGETPTTLDFLALGYLSLCLYPEDLPHPFLSTIMKSEYSRLCAYIHRLRQHALGRPMMDVSEILQLTEPRVIGVPWSPMERGDLPWMTALLVQKALEFVPFTAAARNYRMKERLAKEKAEENMDPEDLVRKRRLEGQVRREKLKSVLAVAGGVAAFIWYIVWTGMITISFVEEEEEEEVEEEEAGTGRFGLAGDILGLGYTGEGITTKEEEKEEEEEEREVTEDVEELVEDVKEELAEELGEEDGEHEDDDE